MNKGQMIDANKRMALVEFKEVLKITKRDEHGDTKKLYIDIVNVSRSGMSREFRMFTNTKKGIKNVTELVAIITGNKYTNKATMMVRGCGMDMAFHICYMLNHHAINLDGYKGKKYTDYNYLIDTRYELMT